ncbi:MAG: hypothetical protein ACI9NQ_000288 [Paracoccaceae bacterium]|jgi:hypothetical protein
MTSKSILNSLLLSGAALATANGSLVAYYPLDGEISALAGGAAATSIPEPSSALLSLAGLLLVVRRRR